MDHGQLVQAGPVGEIVGSGDTLLVGTATPVEEPVVEKVGALPGVASAVRTDAGLLIRLDADGSAPGLVAELVRLEVAVESVGPHRRLEDAFLTLIGDSA
jgi:ABC-2 type transport system ATP-binding protein